MDERRGGNRGAAYRGAGPDIVVLAGRRHRPELAASRSVDAGERRATDGRAERWAEHREQRRAAIVAAGISAIDHYGVDVGVHQIAAQAEVSRTVLYRYFRDKDDLMQAITVMLGQTVVGVVTEALEAEDTPSLMIRATVAATTEWVAAHPRLYLFARRRANSGEGVIEHIEASIAASIGDLLHAILTYLGGEKQLSHVASHAIVGLVENTLAWWIVDRPVPQEVLIEKMYEFIADAIQGYLRRAGIALDFESALPLSALAD